MKKKVLIADADERFRNELVTALEDSEELEVIGAAADGEEAIRIAGENPVDFVILDLLLPKYDGLSVLDSIHALHPDCNAFVVTGFISDFITDALTARCISGLRKKPCSVQCVVDQIREKSFLQ